MTEIDKTLPLVDAQVVYLGLREGRDNKKLFAWFCLPSAIASGINLDTIEEINIASPFDFAKNKLPSVIGGIYTAPCRLSEDGARIQSMAPSFKFSGDKTTPEIVAGCQARDKAARVAQRTRKVESDMAKDSMVADCLKPLRRSYLNTDTIGRLALEVVILAELRKGRAA